MSQSSPNYVGIDVHKSSSSICVMSPDGTVIFETTCATEPGRLITVLKTVADPKDVVLEETTIADFLYRELRPHVHRAVVCDPRHNAYISEDENLNDQTAAYKLAYLLRLNCIKPVHHPLSDARAEFKRVVLFRNDAASELAASRNRLKALFTSCLIPCEGTAIYAKKYREDWLTRLPKSGPRFRAQELYRRIDDGVAEVARIDSEVTRQARQFPEIKLFRQLPAIGLVRAATWFAIIDTPERFVNRGHLWAYCGIGLASRRSAGHQGPEHLNHNGNPALKNLLKSAAVAAINKGDHNRFQRQYEQSIAERREPALARLTVARSMATTMCTMWLTGEDYQDDYQPKPLR